MVHEQVRPLLALALQALEKAKTLFVYRLGGHSLALALAVTAAVATQYHQAGIEIIAATAAILCEFVALVLHHHALELHSHGRQVMRRVMLLDALHPEDAPAVLERARHHLGAGLQQKAAALEEKDRQREPKDRYLVNYYWSDKAPGQARLRDHLFESAIFSHHLYAAAWKFSLLCMVVMLAAAAVALAFLARSSGHWQAAGELHSAEDHAAMLVTRVLIALVAFLPACQELDHLLLYRMVENQLGGLLPQVEACYAVQADKLAYRLQAEFGDYSAATTFAPPIRTLVYRKLVRRLDDEFKARMQALGQTKE
jgi:hypothetical protein